MMADDSIFARAGFSVSREAPASDAPPVASTPHTSAPSATATPGGLFESAGFRTTPDPDAIEHRVAQDAAAKKKEATDNSWIPSWAQLKAYPGHVLQGLVDTVKAPGNLMQANPYPEGSEAWQVFEDSRQKGIQTSGQDIAALTVGGDFPRVGPGALTTAAVERAAPSSRAANALVNAVGPENVPEVVSRLKANPRLSVADVSDPVRTITQGLVDPAQPKVQNLVAQRVKERQSTLPSAVNSAYTEAMGPVPDVMQMVEGLRQRAAAAGTPVQHARGALNDILGESSDPYSVMQRNLKERAEAAAPAYEKAFRGGSMAPLESQFETAFSDATTAVSEANKELSAARQQQLLAKAEQSRAGDNVYANSSALTAGREADAAVAAAEQKLELAQADKEKITNRLRQAQQDKMMNAPGAVWNPRIQQFLDDPIVQSGLAKGERIQRLESLAEGKPYNAREHAITGHDENGNPIVGSVPNMRTLNVVKKGLDQMVDDTKDPVTGRLSEEGRAIDKVRTSFLSELDKVNPDYKAARQAWAGPSQAQDAFNRGLNLFQNKSGASGVNSTPEALASWFNSASKAEQEATKLGARAAFEQQMKMSGDPAAKAAALANKGVNQDKLAVLFGKDQAQKLVDHLNYKFEDPIGQAFEGGFDVLKNRSGMTGLQDRPEALRAWMKTATPEEVVARRLGTRADIDQKIRSVKNQALAGQNITKIEYNQEKLRMLFGDKEADRLIGLMNDAADEAATNAKLLQGSKTAETLAGREALKVRQVEGGNPLGYVMPFASELLGNYYGVPGVGLAVGGGKALQLGAQKIGQLSDLARNYHFARQALATGTERDATINALLAHPKVVRALQKRSNALVAPQGP